MKTDVQKLTAADGPEQYARAAMHMSPGEQRYTAYWQSLVMADEERGLARENESVILKNIPRIIAVLTAAALAALVLRPVIAAIAGLTGLFG